MESRAAFGSIRNSHLPKDGRLVLMHPRPFRARAQRLQSHVVASLSNGAERRGKRHQLCHIATRKHIRLYKQCLAQVH